MLAAVGRDHVKLSVSASCIASGIEEGNVVVRLEYAARRALPRDSQGLAGHHRVILVGPHVELLNFVPKRRLVDWTAQIAEPRRRVEFKIFGLIGLAVAVRRLPGTAAASSSGHVVPNPVVPGPIARKIRMRA